jgi:hypothetical protein
MKEDVKERWRTMWAEVDRRHVEAKEARVRLRNYRVATQS